MKFTEFTANGTRFKIQQFTTSLREQPDNQKADILKSAFKLYPRVSHTSPRIHNRYEIYR